MKEEKWIIIGKKTNKHTMEHDEEDFSAWLKENYYTYCICFYFSLSPFLYGLKQKQKILKNNITRARNNRTYE